MTTATATPGTELDKTQLDGWSLWDRRLIDVASARNGKVSPEELAKLCGGTPAQCAKRLKEILASRDWLGIVETRALILEDMLRLKGMLWEYVEGGVWYGANGKEYGASDPRWAAELRKTISEISRMSELTTQQIADARIQISSAQAKVFLRALDVMFDAFVAQLKEDVPGFDENHYRELVGSEFLPLAVEIVENASGAPQ